MGKKRKRHESGYKAKVAVEAVRERKTVSELSSQFSLHSSQVQAWKRTLLERAHELFEGPSPEKRETAQEAELYEQIGRLKMELEWLKKKLPSSSKARRALVEPEHAGLSQRRQCALLGLPRSTFYYAPAPESGEGRCKRPWKPWNPSRWGALPSRRPLNKRRWRA